MTSPESIEINVKCDLKKLESFIYPIKQQRKQFKHDFVLKFHQ